MLLEMSRFFLARLTEHVFLCAKKRMLWVVKQDFPNLFASVTGCILPCRLIQKNVIRPGVLWAASCQVKCGQILH